MEAGTARVTSGSRTMADLMRRAAEAYAGRPLARHKLDGEWLEVFYDEAGTMAEEIGLGILDLGIAAGDRVAILAQTRPEWTYCDLGITSAAAVVVPVYPTNSAAECEHILADSDAVAIICEDAGQLAKVLVARDRLPALRTIVVIDPAGSEDAGVLTLDALRARGRARDRAELLARQEAVALDDPFTIIYTSGTTGPPKGCTLTHGNYRAMLASCTQLRVLESPDDVVYLFLPLAHSFALLIQLLVVELGATIAYATGDRDQLIAEIGETRPTYLPAVPRVFEKMYGLAQKMLPADELELMSTVGGEIRDLEIAGADVPAELVERFAPVAPKAEFVRNVFGGRLRQAVTGAAPIAPEILAFFWGAGVPVMEGYGMTECATAAAYSTPTHHRFGSVGRPLPGIEIDIADDGEILVHGENVFAGYHKADPSSDVSFGTVIDGWLHTGDLGRLDADGYLTVTGRKKDILITAGGKNIAPANFENELQQAPLVAHCVVFGDQRPYAVALVTLDPDEIGPWAETHDVSDASPAAMAADHRVRAEVQAAIDAVNEHFSRAEQVKRFAIVDRVFSQETGELTPTLKVKRNVVGAMYGDVIDDLYAASGDEG